ncbi:M15 family metallopeptidase [Patescibacteria group bacterium]|nr:M15 family metallopeptidase [Patescibacteria group bacterium]
MNHEPSSHALTPPQILLDDIVALDVSFIDFDGREGTGVIEVHKSIADDVRDVFALMHQMKFPLQSVRPMSEFDYDDDASMAANNTSAFNFRTVTLDPTRLSLHSYGLAIDINPKTNPYINGDRVLSEGATYDPAAEGALYLGHPVVEFFTSRGFVWGDAWDKPYRDIQHFHKPWNDSFEERYRYEVEKTLTEHQINLEAIVPKGR